jgi:hypothetical protein
MKNFKKIIFSLMMALTALVISSCSDSAKVDDSMGVCEILTQNPSWSKALKTARDTYKLPPAFAMAIIYQESKFKAEAKSKGSSAYGYAQAIDGIWKHFQKDVKSNAKRNNFNDSVQFIGWYMAQLAKNSKLKMTDSYNLHMAYMLGTTGFKRYKAGTFKNKAKIIEDKKIAQKVKDFTSHYQAQFNKCKL